MQGLTSAENWGKIIMRFRRGALDQELLEKALVERASLTALHFRFLASFGVENAGAAHAKSDEQLNEAQREAQARRESGAAMEACVQLERDGSKWRQHLQELEHYNCSTQAARSAFRAQEDARNAELINAHIALRFPLRQMENAATAAPFVNASVNAWADAAPLGSKSAQHVYTVYVFNFMIPGSKFLVTARDALSKAISNIAQLPERQCALVLAPNCSQHGHTYHEDAIEDGLNAISEILEDSDNRIKVKRVTFALDDDSIPEQSQRLASHPGLMIISDQHQRGHADKLASLFASSKLWKRAGVTQLQCMRVADMTNPCQKIMKAGFDATKDLPKGVRAKQWMAGPKLWAQIRARLWQGMNLNSSDTACLVDMYAFEGSIAESVVRTSQLLGQEAARMPSEMVVSTVFAPMDMERPDVNEAIASFLERNQQAALKDQLVQKMYFVEGFAMSEYVADTPKPCIADNMFKACHVTSTGTLAVKQDWVNSVAQKTGAPESEAWTLVSNAIAAHNESFNAGAATAPDADDDAGQGGVKRPGVVGRLEGRQPDPIKVPAGATDPKSRTELVAAFDAAGVSYVTVNAQEQELFIGSDASCWLYGIQEGEVSHLEALFLVYGRFHIGAQAEQALSNANGAFRYGFTDPGSLVNASVSDNISLKGEFTTELSTLGQFYKFLADNDHVNVAIECHQASLKFETDHADVATSSTLEVSPKQPACFSPTAVPTGNQEDWQNVGSRLLVPSAAATAAGRAKMWSTDGVHKLGLLVMYHHLKYDQVKSGATSSVRPTKPGIYLSKPLKIGENELVRLA